MNDDQSDCIQAIVGTEIVTVSERGKKINKYCTLHSSLIPPVFCITENRAESFSLSRPSEHEAKIISTLVEQYDFSNVQTDSSCTFCTQK